MNIPSAFINRASSAGGFRVYTAGLFFIISLIMFAVLYSNVKSDYYQVELFSVAEETIRAPKTVEDIMRTKEEQERAGAEISDAYVYHSETAKNQTLLVKSLFDYIMEANGRLSGSANAAEITSELVSLKENLSNNAKNDVNKILQDEVLLPLLLASSADLDKTQKIVMEQVELILQKKIREDDLEAEKNEMEKGLLQADIPNEIRKAAVRVGRYAVVPTERYDKELTEQRKLQAMENVEPVLILQGQVLVQKNHIIDREIYRQLELLGLLDRNKSWKPIVGLFVFTGVAAALLYYCFASLQIVKEKKKLQLSAVSLVFIFNLFLMKLTSGLIDEELPLMIYLFPAAMAPFMLKALLNERAAMPALIILSCCGSIMFNDTAPGTLNMEIGIYMLISGLAGILFLQGTRTSDIVRAGFRVAVLNVLVILCLQMLASTQLTWLEYVYYIINALLSGLLSAILTIGILPLFEAGFGILTSMRLIELSSPNHPLLKKLLVEAPGTYHHSVMVANLSEAACEAIGANGLLARVGCYYHDIGKTKRPHFFIENQSGKRNPHDRLPPEASKDIIISHVEDGVAMLKDYQLPQEIIDIAEQHHGTTLVKYFYFKAKEKNEAIEEEMFRYSGPKPQSREIAVINIADSVEAAVRSMDHPTSAQIYELVEGIVLDRLHDGQFNECDLTLRELEIVKKTLCETVNGIFHSRIEYPKDKQWTSFKEEEENGVSD